jgi:hypothetical protein
MRSARRNRTDGHAARAVSTSTLKDLRTTLAPMRRREATQATELAVEAVLRKGGVRDRLRIYGPGLRVEKPRHMGGTPRRMIYVRVRNRDEGVVHDILIEGGTLIEHVVVRDANPPFSEEERNEALDLISKDRTLGRTVRRKGVGILWFQPHQQDDGRRVIGARLFRVKNQRGISPIIEARVDLDRGILLTENRYE